MSRSIRAGFGVALLTAAISGCSTMPPEAAWQEVVWRDGYIPLPSLAVMRVVEPDPGKPGTFRLVEKSPLVGSFREARAEDFRRDREPWAWREIPQLSGTDLRVRLTPGADQFLIKNAAKLKLNAARLRSLDVGVDVGPSASLELHRMWHLDAPRLGPDTFHLVFRPLIIDLAREPEPKTFFLITRVLASDIDEKKSLGLKIGGKLEGEFPVDASIDATSSWHFKGQGVALGVQGQIVTRTVRSAMRPLAGRAVPITRGQNSLDLQNKDLIEINRDDKNRLRIRWAAVPDAAVYSRTAAGKLEVAAEWTDPNPSYILAGDIKLDGGRILAISLGTDNEGAPVVIAAAAYDLAFRNLDSSTLVSYFNPRPQPPKGPNTTDTTDEFDRPAWIYAVGYDDPLTDFFIALGQVLAIKPDPAHARFERFDFVDAFAFIGGEPAQFVQARVTRYDIRGLGGKKLALDIYRTGPSGIARSRVWTQRGSQPPVEIASFAGSSLIVTIPEGDDYLYMRTVLTRDKQRVNWTGFHRMRHAPVDGLTWEVGFAEPLTDQCKLVLGEARPEPPTVGAERARGQLASWARVILAIGANEGEKRENLPRLQEVAKRDLAICRYSLSNVGRKIAVMFHVWP